MLGRSVEVLRREFDAVFALPLREGARDLVHLLAVRVAGQPYALRVSELGGVAAGRRVTPVPSPEPAFVGLVGIRGALLAVHDLATLLGLPRAGSTNRWVALAGSDAKIAFAFEELEGHLRLAPSALETSTGTAGGYCEYAVRVEAALRPVASVPRLVEAVLDRARRERQGKVT